MAKLLRLVLHTQKTSDFEWGQATADKAKVDLEQRGAVFVCRDAKNKRLRNTKLDFQRGQYTKCCTKMVEITLVEPSKQFAS